VGSLGCILAACSYGQTGEIGYGVATSGDGNQLAIAQDENAEPGSYIVAITSERGIGQASITWWGNQLPHHVVFQLYLTGLEQFSLRWADQAVNVSVNSMDQTVIQSVKVAETAEQSIAAGSPYWMDVVAPSTADGPFQLQAPPAFIDAAPKVWGISWIDYYR
jgi:hypothetical protein